MKISIDVDLSPEELRQFLGLPNVEKLQQEMLNRAQDYLQNAGQSQYAELVTGAMQPLFAYQNWVQKMMTGSAKDSRKANKESDSE